MVKERKRVREVDDRYEEGGGEGGRKREEGVRVHLESTRNILKHGAPARASIGESGSRLTAAIANFLSHRDATFL